MIKIADDRALVMTTDFFPPVVDDPFTFGRIAAANAFSDVYAMGGRPIAALNLLGVPSDVDPEVAAEILAGAAAIAIEAGAAIVGGHTVEDDQLKFGLAVTGEVHPERFIRNNTIQANDFLVLTKPLGAGLITSSIKTLGNQGDEVDEAIRWMTTLNSTALDVILEAEPHAMTDVTGFGLLGHLDEMLAGQRFVAKLQMASIPRIPGVERCFKPKCRTRAAKQTRTHLGDKVSFHKELGAWDRELLFDPQTSGGLLIALPPSRAEVLARRLRAEGLDHASVIGAIVPADAAGISVNAEPPPRSFTRG